MNNECLLHTIVQLLPSADVTITQAQLHHSLVESEIIEDGDLIDIFDPYVTQAIAAQFEVGFQLHRQVYRGGAVLNYPVIGNSQGPVLHIFYRSNHFSPMFPKG